MLMRTDPFRELDRVTQHVRLTIPVADNAKPRRIEVSRDGEPTAINA
jgi:hypothetical protein